MKIEINLKIVLVIILFLIFNNINSYLIFIAFIIIHELSHLIFGIMIGGKPQTLQINPLGVCLDIYSYEKANAFYKILFYAVGPLSNFVVAFFIIKLEILNEYREQIIYTNWAIGVFNLLPILPLDGGKILKEILKIFIGADGATSVMMIVTKVFLAILSFGYGIFVVKIQNLIFLFLLIYLWYLYFLEEKKYKIYKRANECIKNMSVID